VSTPIFPGVGVEVVEDVVVVLPEGTGVATGNAAGAVGGVLGAGAADAGEVGAVAAGPGGIGVDDPLAGTGGAWANAKLDAAIRTRLSETKNPLRKAMSLSF
jgi:hypothetical protein